MNRILVVMVSSSFGLAPGCAQSGADATTITLTAADLDDGSRPVIDLSLPLSWVIDGTEEPVDLGRIDVSDGRELVPLDAWLTTDLGIDAQDVEDMEGRRIEIRRSHDVQTPPEAAVAGASNTGYCILYPVFWGRYYSGYDAICVDG